LSLIKLLLLRSEPDEKPVAYDFLPICAGTLGRQKRGTVSKTQRPDRTISIDFKSN